MASEQQPTGHYRVERGRAAEFRKVPWIRYRGAQVIGVVGVQSMSAYTWSAYVWSVFVRYFMQEYKWTAAAVGFFASFLRINNFWIQPLSGWMGDTFGPRLVTSLGLLALVACWAGFAMTTEYWHVLVAYGVFQGLGSGLWSRGMNIAVVRWWVDRRGMAMALQWILSGLSGTVFLPLVTLAMDIYGWRWGGWLGVIVIGACVPLCLAYPDHFPEQYGQYVDNQSPEEKRARAERAAAQRGVRPVVRPALADLTVREAMVDRAFWLLTLGGILVAAGAAPLSLFQNARMGALGYSVVAAALFYSLRNWLSYAGRFFMLFFSDWLGINYPVRYTYAVIVWGQGLALLLFGYGTSDIWFYGWAVINGFFYGCSLMWLNYLLAAYFGRAAFGFLGGIRAALTATTGFIAPALMGWLADTYGWSVPFAWACFCYVIGGIGYWFAVPPKKQAREVTKEQQTS